jgi:hypothetical protein
VTVNHPTPRTEPHSPEVCLCGSPGEVSSLSPQQRYLKRCAACGASWYASPCWNCTRPIDSRDPGIAVCPECQRCKCSGCGACNINGCPTNPYHRGNRLVRTSRSRTASGPSGGPNPPRREGGAASAPEAAVRRRNSCVSPPFLIPTQIEAVFESFANAPFHNHPPTQGWQEEVLATNRLHHTRVVLNRGRTDFDTAHGHLHPADKVCLYCYYYLQMHAASTAYVFDTAVKHCGLGLSGHPILIDFGCGPLTLGIGLAWHDLLRFGQRRGESRLPLDYLGIDRSRAMTNRATEIAQKSGLFDAQSTFEFAHSVQQDAICKHIDARLEALRGTDVELILNFSYFLGSSSLIVSHLTGSVRYILERYSRVKRWLVYQNPNHQGLAQSWSVFKAGLGVLQSAEERNERLAFLNTPGREGSQGVIQLHWALLFGQPHSGPAGPTQQASLQGSDSP